MNVKLSALVLLALAQSASAGIDSPFDREFGTPDYHGGDTRDRLIGTRDRMVELPDRDHERQEAARQEAARQEAARQEAARQEAAAQEAAAREAAAREAAAREAALAEFERQKLAALEQLADEDKLRGEEAQAKVDAYNKALSGEGVGLAIVELGHAAGKADAAVRSNIVERVVDAFRDVVNGLVGVEEATIAEREAFKAYENGQYHELNRQAASAKRNEQEWDKLIPGRQGTEQKPDADEEPIVVEQH